MHEAGSSTGGQVSTRLGSLALAPLVLSALVAGCSAEAEYTVGLGTGDGSGISSVAAAPSDVEVKSTAIPSQWPADIPQPSGGRVDNVVVLDKRISVSWIVAADDLLELTRVLYDGFGEEACDGRMSDATETYGRIECTNSERSVTIDITPLGQGEAQVLTTFQPSLP